jgi:hypothetical protein
MERAQQSGADAPHSQSTRHLYVEREARRWGVRAEGGAPMRCAQVSPMENCSDVRAADLQEETTKRAEKGS